MSQLNPDAADTQQEWAEYYVTVRFKVKAQGPDVARDQIKDWLLRTHKAIQKYKTLYLPPGIHRVFEIASEAERVEP